MNGTIVVAVNPSSPSSAAALLWAAAEARLRGARVHAVMAWRPPRPPAAPAARPPAVSSLTIADPQAEAETRLREVVDAALGDRHDVTCSAVRGSTLPVLLTAARDADMIVVDSPHPIDLTQARASLLAPQLVFRVRCPVVVIPPVP